jgi:hypothetical protein
MSPASPSRSGQLRRTDYEPSYLPSRLTATCELLFTFGGPGRLWTVARVDVDDGLRGAKVESLVRGIESGLKHGAEEVYRVDVVPIGGSQASP